MSKDISNTTGIFNTKLTKQGSPHSAESNLLRFEEIVIPIGKKNETTPSSTATAKNLIANSSVSKPRQTNKEYMTTQKVYDVLKEPADYKQLKSALSVKPINMKYTAVPLVGNKMIHISFPTFINAMFKEQLATTSNEAAFRSKPKVTVKLPTKDASPAAATTVLVDTTKTTNTTIPTIMRPTAVVSTANPTELTQSLKNSEIDVGVSQPPKATAMTTEYEKIIPVTTTAETEIESFNSNTTSTSSLKISAVDINGKVTTNTAPITAPSASTTKSIACNNIRQKLTFNKKSVMRSVNIPLSIASKAHKTLAFARPKMPIRPLIKSRNCVLLSTKSNTTAKDKGIIKFIPKSPRPKQYVADESDVSNPTDSNSNDALISKDVEKLPESGKEVLVITTDIDTKKTAVNIPVVPLVGKRKYTDPAVMPILSFSYQKSLSDYIRKAKEFHKRAKICATAALATIDNSKINEVESAKNFISTDSDRSGNNDNTNMKCDHESNLKQGDSTAERRKEVTAMEVEEEANGESEYKEKSTDMETTEKIGSIKYVKSTIKDIHNLKDMETVEKLENVRTTSLDNLKYLKALTDVKSAPSIDNLTNVQSAESPKNPEDNESGQNTDELKKEESANGTKKTEYIESTERTNNSREKETAEGIKDLKGIESAENRDQLKDLKSGEDTNDLKDVRSVNDTKVREDIESTKHTNNSRENKTPEGIKNLKDIESSENKDHSNDLESTEDIENLKNMKSTEGTNNLKYGKSAEKTEKLKDIETKILKDVESTEITGILKNMESTERRETPKCLKDNLKVKESVEYTDNLKEVESAERTQNRKNVESTGDTDSPEEVKSTQVTVNLKDIEVDEGTDSLKDLESTESIKILHGIESAKSAYKPDLKSAQKTENRSDFESAESIRGRQDLESTESTKTLKVLKSTESAENLKVMESIERAKNLKDIKSAEDSNNANNIESAEVKEMRQDMETTECVDNQKNIATTAEMSNQIDIESDLFTYEIFNNVSGINNASSRNEHTQTKDSTIKILKNIFELKEKVQQQAEEIMSLKAAMKLLKTPNMLNRP